MGKAAPTTLRDTIETDARRILEDLTYSFKALYNTEEHWQRRHFLLGVPATALGMVAGGTATTGIEPWVTALLGFAAAFFAAALTVVHPERRARAARTHAEAAQKHHGRVRRWLEMDLHQLDEDEARHQFEDLAEAKVDVLRGAPHIPNSAFRKARQGVREGEALHEVDGGS